MTMSTSGFLRSWLGLFAFGVLLMANRVALVVGVVIKDDLEAVEPVVFDSTNIYKDYYELQTLVYAEFGDGWWAGYIESYQGEYYVVRWSDDTSDRYLPGEAMDSMVLSAAESIPRDYEIWPVGTMVYKEFGDGLWYWGTMEYSNAGFYTILWDDDERTSYVVGWEIDEMVAFACQNGVSESCTSSSSNHGPTIWGMVATTAVAIVLAAVW